MIRENLENISKGLPSGVKLVAVSKFHPAEAVREAYSVGQRVFGESRPQEFKLKAESLPKDIEWHFIGHLQTNKLKMVLPYASLVQSVDSLHLLEAIDAWGRNNSRIVDVLLEVHVAAEDTKSGFTPAELMAVLRGGTYSCVRFCGLMGMASNTGDESRIREDFSAIRELFDTVKKEFPGMNHFRELSIGMSGDWKIALDYGATMVRIGTAIFGERDYLTPAMK